MYDVRRSCGSAGTAGQAGFLNMWSTVLATETVLKRRRKQSGGLAGENLRLDEKLVETETKFYEKCREIPHAENILEISGICENILSGIQAEMGDQSRFGDAAELQGLSELGLVACNSGKHKGETKISYRGRKKFRYWLFQAAVVLLFWNFNIIDASFRIYTSF